MRWPWNRPEPTNNDLANEIRELKRRQELLEDYTDQKLDMMRGYAARVDKRARDAARNPKTHEPEAVDELETSNPRVAALLARRASRLASRRPSVPGG